MMILWIVLGAAVLAVLMFIGIFNSLVALRNQTQNAWSQIDVQLKRRYDLIPNLLEAVKGYMGHERATLENVTRARSQAMSAQSVGEKSRAEGALTDSVNKFFLVVENYPELKANQNFMALQEELRSTENKIAFARQSYNDQILFYNNKLQMFPSNVVAGCFQFKQGEYFQMDDAAHRAAPQVKF
ncbi:MAG: LemA family protein [Candidatus Omnitrophica bacterium]|nr:LemA family protein [Candidatus Omnitrophota bacterium]